MCWRECYELIGWDVYVGGGIEFVLVGGCDFDVGV